MSKAKILVVEDEWIIADDLKNALERMGYSVPAVAASGEEAIAKVEQERPDLVLMDIILRDGMTGIKAAETIHGLNVPHIFITAYGDETILDQAKVTQPFGYLLKPFDDRELNAVIEMALYKHKMETKLRESEEKFRTLFDQAADSIFLLSFAKDGLIIEVCNAAALRAHGYTEDEMIGMAIGDLDDPETRRELPGRARILELGEPLQFEGRHVRKDGSTFPVDVTARLLRIEGKPFVLAIDRDITARKRAEELLQNKNQLLMNVIESLTQPFYVINAGDYSLELMNSAAREIAKSGASTCYAISHHMSEPCQGDGHPCVLEEIKRTARPAVVEHMHYDKDGNVSIVEVHGYPIFDERGNICQIIEYNLDITDRKKAEEKLKESEERYRMLFHRAPLGIMHFTRDGYIVDCNDRFAEIIGATKEKIIKFNLIKSLRDEHMKAAFQSCLSGETGHFEGDYTSVLAGKLSTVQADFAPLYLADNTVIGGIGIFEDITERKAAADELRRQKDTLQKYLDISAVMVVMIDRERKATLINRKGCEILGYREDEVIGKDWFDNFIPERSRAEVKDVFSKLISGDIEPVEYYENAVVTRSGEEKIIAWYNTVFRDDAGKIIATLGSGGDITERKKAERERERLTAELKHKNKEMEQFVSVTSHDLRTPLAIIQGYARELMRSIDRIIEEINALGSEVLKKKLYPYLNDVRDTNKYIESNIHKMDSLLYRLLKLSRSGNVELTIKTLDMNSLIGEVREAFTPKIREAGADVQIADLPSCRGDAVQINQVFSNLLGNALKYLDADRSGKIIFSGRSEAGESVYCIEDNGIGIAAEAHARIFDIFYRGGSAAAGEGLGLAIVKKIIDRHGGRVWVESEPGAGSSFYVALPA